MKIGVMSDSHGDYAAIEQAILLGGDIDFWMHAGDLCSDADYLAACTGLRVLSVAGNCDGLAAKYPPDEFIKIGGKKIWLTHGHNAKVKYGLHELLFWADQYEADVAIYGHTHVVDVSWHGKLLVLNPGSVARPHYAKASFLKITMEHNDIVTNLVELS